MKVREDGNTISAETYQALRSSILFGRIAPGTKVTTSELCKRFGASLGAVREALSHLRAEGLVTAEAHRGYTISPISIADLRDLTQVRIDIETMCLKRSVEAGELDWETNLVGAAHRLSKSYRENEPDGSPNPAFESAHDTFHLALVNACDSPRLLKIRAQLFDESERYRRLNAALESGRDPAEEHRLMTEAALARNVARATKLMTEHIARTAENVINSMTSKESARKPKPRAKIKRKSA